MPKRPGSGIRNERRPVQRSKENPTEFSFFHSRFAASEDDQPVLSIPEIGLKLSVRMEPEQSNGTMSIIETENAPKAFSREGMSSFSVRHCNKPAFPVHKLK